MGQQQLLLLVLGIVIVGLSVVLGINAFSENRIKASADAVFAMRMSDTVNVLSRYLSDVISGMSDRVKRCLANIRHGKLHAEDVTTDRGAPLPLCLRFSTRHRTYQQALEVQQWDSNSYFSSYSVS